MTVYVKQSDIRAMFVNKLCGGEGLIQVPENAEYSVEDVTNVALYAAVSSSNSIESAVEDLKMINSDSKVPSADTVHNYIKQNDIGKMMSFFRKMNSEFIDMVNIRNTSHIIAIDFHDIPYYGDRNTKGVVGIKPKNGTSWGHSYFTADLIGDCKLTLEIVNLTGLNKSYATLIEGVVNRVNQIGISTEVMLMDREFFNLDSIITLDTTGINFIMPAIVNKRIKKPSVSSRWQMAGFQGS